MANMFPWQLTWKKLIKYRVAELVKKVLIYASCSTFCFFHLLTRFILNIEKFNFGQPSRARRIAGHPRLGWEDVMKKNLKEMETSCEGVKRDALSRLGGGGACVAVLASGGLVLRWVVSSSSSSTIFVWTFLLWWSLSLEASQESTVTRLQSSWNVRWQKVNDI